MSTHAVDAAYTGETWTDQERNVLRRYFTNLDGPVFALVNLPEVVKGALFARYSRSAKSLRRLFLDEFVHDLDVSGDHSIDATVGLRRAEELYEKVFYEYGDDSVAQLGGVHLACEQVSNLLTKVLERGRLMSYMEKSTRYVAYDTRLSSGHYRYYRSPEILASPLGARYVGDMDRIFDTYSELRPVLYEWYAREAPRAPGGTSASLGEGGDIAYRRALRAKAFDALRGLLPAAALSNVGIYGSGQGFETLLLHMRAHPLPEARLYSDLMLNELRKVIPSWVRRVEVPDRGAAWSEYLRNNTTAMAHLAPALLEGDPPEASPALGWGDGQASLGASRPEVRLLDWDPEAEAKVVTAMLYPFCHLPEAEVAARVAAMPVEQRLRVMRTYAGERRNRRHRPGRALERSGYRFEVVSDYGAFRDLQRHRLLTIEWQQLTPYLGYSMPAAVAEAGRQRDYDKAMERSAQLYYELDKYFGPDIASYAVTLAHRVRYVVQMNAREAMHLLELRTTPQGHAEYREVCQQMHRLIAEVAGHGAIAAMMNFVDHSGSSDQSLGRLQSELRADARRRR
ncbi:MAG: FAD-dependent thymidylate synthase [Actinobacteria bacterium]|nr:FAD-dependent thymidylate synthase [Actinomycetota bacterium]